MQHFFYKLTLFATCAIGLTACVVSFPDLVRRGVGTIDGAVTLEWLDTRKFVYLPLTADPLVYRFPDDVRISSVDEFNNNPELRRVEPSRMFTDSGSIPRPVWGVPGLSPLDYVPAYVVHDWLYFQRHCYRQGKGRFAGLKEFPYLLEAADYALFDALVLIDRKRGREDEGRTSRSLIRAAVTRFGRKYWNNKEGRCDIPPERKQIVRTRTVERPVSTTDAGGRFVTVIRKQSVRVRESNYRRLAVFGVD